MAGPANIMRSSLIIKIIMKGFLIKIIRKGFLIKKYMKDLLIIIIRMSLSSFPS